MFKKIWNNYWLSLIIGTLSYDLSTVYKIMVIPGFIFTLNAIGQIKKQDHIGYLRAFIRGFIYQAGITMVTFIAINLLKSIH